MVIPKVTQKQIKISPELHTYLASHGRFGERFEDIIIRLIGVDNLKNPTGDVPAETYNADDIDSKKTKIKRRGK